MTRSRTQTLSALAGVAVASTLTATTLTATTLTAPAASAVPAAPVASEARHAPARLPAPTGELDVAARTLHLVDRDRRDPWVGGPRRLVVTMTYPTARPTGRSGYVTPAESRALLSLQASNGVPLPDDLPRGILSRTVTGVAGGGPVLRTAGGRPLVLLSPGLSLTRSSLTALASDLASRGYVTAQVSHPHEDSGTQLPSGRLTGCEACSSRAYAQVPRGRSRDLSFVLDRLAASPTWSGVVDEGEVGVVGHSIGGNAALTLAQEDRRVDAAVDLDGTVFDRVRRPLRTPAMLLGTASLHRPGGGDATWDRTWRRLAADRTWLTVRGSDHMSSTDNPVLVEQLLGLRGDLGGRRAVAITRAHVAAFLDRHLRGREAPVLDGPSAAYPEVRHHTP